MEDYDEYWGIGRGVGYGMGVGRGLFAGRGAAYGGVGRGRGGGRGMGAGFGAGPRIGIGMHGYYGAAGFNRRFVGLRYWILNLLYEKEMTGAQIADALEELSNGRWRPSPGHIYPTLSSMEEEGYIKAREESNQKYYSITQEGKRLLDDFGIPMGRGLWYHSGNSDLALRYIRSYVTYLERDKELIRSNEKRKSEIKELIERLRSLLE